MKKLLILIVAAAAVAAVLIYHNRQGTDQGLEADLRKSLDSKTFDITKLDDHTIVLNASDMGRHFLTRDDIKNLMSDKKKKGETWEVSKFKVMDKYASPDSRFATVTYRVAWNISGGDKKKAELVSHEIWERQVD